ncbi:hypothetical protein PputUW4_02683 [Pseudomonas sp. UW4]|nr:hypothetical protein PputUW4_02683 [Pseudomonas sp. UW4]
MNRGAATSVTRGMPRTVSTANRGEQMSRESMQRVEVVQSALVGISQAVTRITGMSQQMASASEEQSHVAEDINQQITRIAQLCDHSAGQAKQGAAISQETGRFLLRQGLRQLMLIICRSEPAREGR